MKRSRILNVVACAGLLLGSAWSVSAVLAQPTTKDLKKEAEKLTQPTKDAKPAAPAQPDPAQMEAEWGKLMALNEHHERFKKMEGSWTAEVKHWMDPAAAPEESKGTMVNTLVHGGRYLRSEYTGTMGGESFTGSGTMGYNNATNKYEGTWIDNMGTGTMLTTGKYDEHSKTYTMTGDMDMGSMGKMAMREVVTLTDDDHHSMVMYMTMAGMPETKVMEIKYTRAGTKKADAGSAIDAARNEADKKAKEAADKLKKQVGK
ncbi:MAG: DUF1579 domain-containing protein [Phycisphaerales bacterium]